MKSPTPTSTPPAPVAVAAPATRLALEFDALLALFASEARTDLGAAVVRGLEPAADEEELRRRRARYEEIGRLSLEAPLVPGLGDGLGELVARLESGDPPLVGGEILRLAALLAAGGAAAARIAAVDPPCAELSRAVAGVADPQPLVLPLTTLPLTTLRSGSVPAYTPPKTSSSFLSEPSMTPSQTDLGPAPPVSEGSAVFVAPRAPMRTSDSELDSGGDTTTAMVQRPGSAPPPPRSTPPPVPRRSTPPPARSAWARCPITGPGTNHRGTPPGTRPG